MGALLLSRSNFFGGQKTGGGSAEVSDIGTLPSEEEEPPLTDPLSDSATGLDTEGEEMGEYTPPTVVNLSEEAPNQPIKAPTPTKLKKPKEVVTSKASSLKKEHKKTKLKKKPATKEVKKAVPSALAKSKTPNQPLGAKTSDLKEQSTESVMESQKPGQSGEQLSRTQNQVGQPVEEPTEEWVDEEERVLVSEKPKKEEWVDEDEFLAPTENPQSAKQDQTAWVDEEEEIKENQQSNSDPVWTGKPLVSAQGAGFPTASPPPSPGNKMGSSNIPALDVGSARRHNQLKQVAGNPLPVYPEEALKKKWEGRAEVFYYVNPAGFVEKVQLKKSSGHRALDNAALRALARYRYHPGQEGWVRHPVEFFLDLDKEIKQTAPLGGGLSKSTIQRE